MITFSKSEVMWTTCPKTAMNKSLNLITNAVMPMVLKRWFLAGISMCAVTLSFAQSVQTLPKSDPARCSFSTPAAERAFACNALLNKSVNIGNVFDTPREGIQGNAFQDEYLQAAKKAGFTAIRLPIRWDARAPLTAPFAIQERFMQRIDHVVQLALKENIALIIDMHHFVGMTLEPDTEVPRFLAVWKQVAERYKDAPATVMFELLNEPHGKLTPEKWQAAFDAVLPIVRASNPHRTLIAGGGEWNSARGLTMHKFPESDPNIIGTFHYYDPMNVTHQGAEWVTGSTAWLGTKWAGTAEERVGIENTFDRMVDWGKEFKRPVFLGEFGVYNKAEHSSRLAWTRAVREAAEARNISWAYWELISSFGILEPRSMEWRRDLLETLLPPKR
jgi:endoglucanase